MIDADLVIIGGGPAGMAAATEAAQHNLKIVLIDENASLGGKVLRKESHEKSKSPKEPVQEKIRHSLFTAFGKIENKITIFKNTEVWSIDDQKIIECYCKSEEGSRAETVRAKKMIVAVGAADKTVPFPGWHLPGVFTVGGLNTFVQRGVVPGKKVIVAGTGPLHIALAYNLVNAGIKIGAIVDTSSFKEMLFSAGKIFLNGGIGKLLLGLKYLVKIKRNSVDTYHSHAVVEARGTDRVTGVVIAKVDPSWRPIPGTEIEIPADTIATGYSLAPQTEVTRLCGCAHTYNEKVGYWMVDRDDKMETSVSGVFVAGDGADIKGYDAAVDEGRVAALAVSEQLAAKNAHNSGNNFAELTKKLRQAQKIGLNMSSMARVRPGIFEAITDDTIICRCEEVCYKDIKAAIKESAKDVNDIKRRTRLGMGNCQGRFCGQVVNELIWQASGKEFDRTFFTVRPPLKPVPLSCIAGLIKEDQN
jgi:thioredoxin reductase/bacterioferritin-associated ferredoxin